MEQIFLILDRIVAYRGLDIVSVMAVGVFKKRSKILFNCKSHQDVDKLFLRIIFDDSFIENVQLVLCNNHL